MWRCRQASEERARRRGAIGDDLYWEEIVVLSLVPKDSDMAVYLAERYGDG